jgi:hypothetical protein
MTLTLRSTDAGLAETISRLYQCFARLRRSREIGKCMSGGLYFLELTLNSTTLQWHPHLHVLYEGSFIPVKRLSEVWHQTTGDSYIVDLRALRDSKAAAGYVSKYAGKALGANVVLIPQKLQEAMRALAGRRVFSCFGDWQHLSLSKAREDATEWECIGALGAVIRDAQRGVPEALAILRQLRSCHVTDPLTLFDSPPEDGVLPNLRQHPRGPGDRLH